MNNPLVVGYKGEIGSFILNGLLRIMPKALNIWCVDINETEAETTHRIKLSDVIFLCVPLKDTLPWLIINKSLLKGKIILEQTSLKGWLNHKVVQGLDVRSMHILFRPSQTPDFADRTVGLFKHEFSQTDHFDMIDIIRNITQSKIVFFENVQQHDIRMAVQQALLHRTILVMGQLLRECEGSTYISKKVLELEARIKKGNLDLYSAIQDNKYLTEALAAMRDELANFDIKKYFKETL